MDLIVALVVGVLLGAGLVFAVLSGMSRRSRDAVDLTREELDEVRGELSSTKESLVRMEAQRDAERQAASEKLALLEEAKAKLQESFKALSSDALAKNNESFLKLAEENLKKFQESAKGDLEKRQESISKTVEPVGKALELFNERVVKIEERRTATDASLKQQLEQLSVAQSELSRTTGSLVQALRAPQVRGQWGDAAAPYG